MANFSLVITYLSFFFLLSGFCHSFNSKMFNASNAYDKFDSSYDSGSAWSTTRATWFGPATGAGNPAGGACGYKDATSAPFNSLVAAVAPPLFSLGCGSCFHIKCATSPFCSGNPVTVVATDSCNDCDHFFDLSGTSFGAMANDGDADSLRHLGILDVQYMQVDCNFVGVDVTFCVQEGSNPSYLAFAVEFEDGRGVLEVAVRVANSYGAWVPMNHLWGAIYKVNFASGSSTGPFSVQLNDGSQTIVADNVIPANYEPGVPYTSTVNFKV